MPYLFAESFIWSRWTSEQQQLAFERSYWRACRDWLETRAHLDTLVGEIDR